MQKSGAPDHSAQTVKPKRSLGHANEKGNVKCVFLALGCKMTAMKPFFFQNSKQRL